MKLRINLLSLNSFFLIMDEVNIQGKVPSFILLASDIKLVEKTPEKLNGKLEEWS